MPLIPIDAVQEAVKDLLTKVRAGLGEYAHASGEGLRLGKATISMEVTFVGDEVVQSRQETEQDLGVKLTTTTEEPIGSNSDSHGEKTTTVKTGNYVQSGTQGTSQGGGSQEVQRYEYDEA